MEKDDHYLLRFDSTILLWYYFDTILDYSYFLSLLKLEWFIFLYSRMHGKDSQPDGDTDVPSSISTWATILKLSSVPGPLLTTINPDTTFVRPRDHVDKNDDRFRHQCHSLPMYIMKLRGHILWSFSLSVHCSLLGTPLCRCGQPVPSVCFDFWVGKVNTNLGFTSKKLADYFILNNSLWLFIVPSCHIKLKIVLKNMIQFLS